jgi:hypothetical protein
MNPECQLATENTEFTEGKRVVTVNIDFTDWISRKNMWSRRPLRDLCGLN